MLHMVLVILKIIGILLAALAALLLLILGCLLFVPVRYRIRLKKDKETLSGEAAAFWLLHLLSFSLAYSAGRGRPGIQIRIFGISLERFRKRRRRPAEEAPVEDEPAEEEPLPEEDREEEEESSWKEESSGKEESSWKEESFEKEESSEKKESFEKEEDLEEKEAFREKPEQSRKEAFGRWKDRLLRLKQKPGQWSRSFRRKKRRLASTVSLIREYRPREVLELLWGYAKKLARHFRPRKIRGFLKFGTGDPALTGELTGILYLLLPVSAKDFSLEPEFHEAALEADLTAWGRIRGIHLLVTAVEIFRNKQLKKIIRRLRSTLEC